MRLIVLNNRPWAIGLLWSPPLRHFAASRKTLLEHALEHGGPDLDVMARYHPTHGGTQKGQEGFGASGGIWKDWRGARSLAACLDVPASFLGVFPLVTPQGEPIWWVHCRMDGLFPEQGDQVFRSETAALEACALLEHVSGIREIVRLDSAEASAAWLSERCRLSTADLWVRDRGRLLNLHQTLSGTALLRAAVALGLTVCVAGTAVGVNHHIRRAEFEAARQAHLARVQRQKDLKERPEAFFDMAWQKAPTATDMARQCLPALMDLPLASNGWDLGKAVCSGRELALEWQHAAGGDFIHLPDNGKLDGKDSRIAHSTRPLPPLARHARRPDGPGTDHAMLVRQDVASGLLSQIAQDTGTKLELRFAAQARKTIDKVAVTAPWHVGSWSLGSIPDLLMGEGEGGLFAMLAEVPGLTIESIDYDGSWSVKGKLYAVH